MFWIIFAIISVACPPIGLVILLLIILFDC